MTTEPPANADSTRQSPAPDVGGSGALASMVLPRTVVRQERRVRSLILDYALGTSLLGLLPIPRFFTLKLVLSFGLTLKMVWDIGKLWRFRQGQDVLAIAGIFFGLLGAFAMTFTAWLTFLGVGVFVPYLRGLALAAALFTLPWSLGQVVNQFYASGYEPESGKHEN